MSARRKYCFPQRGFTLLELVVTIVLIGVAMGAVALLVATLGGRSAAPVLQTQALYLAEGYLEEALSRPFLDPDGVAEGCAVARGLWDDIGDFGTCLGTAVVPTDAAGNTLLGLSRYRVAMTVGPNTVVGGATTRRIEAIVTHLDGGVDVRVAALRAQY